MSDINRALQNKSAKPKNIKKPPKWQDDKRNDFTLDIDESKIDNLRTIAANAAPYDIYKQR